MLPSCCARLRNNVCIGILAGSLILSGAGCWAVWGPLIGVGAAGVGAAGGAAIVARKTRAPKRLSISPAPDQTDAGRAPPTSSPQIAFANRPGSPVSTAVSPPHLPPQSPLLRLRSKVPQATLFATAPRSGSCFPTIAAQKTS